MFISNSKCLQVRQSDFVYWWLEVRPLFNLKTKQTVQGSLPSLVNSLRGRVDKAGVIIFEWSQVRIQLWSHFWHTIFFLFSTSNSNSLHLFYGKRSNSGHKIWLKLSTVSMSMPWQMSLVDRLGSGARSWDRIGLGLGLGSALVTVSHTWKHVANI